MNKAKVRPEQVPRELNTNKMKNLILKLEQFNKATKELSKEWTEATPEICDLVDVENYPFDESFDELTNNINNWVNASIKRINEA